MPLSRGRGALSVLRLAGCAVVLFAASVSYADYAASLDERAQAYSRVVRFISFVRREIAFYETPFPQIVEKFAAAEKLTVGGDEADRAGVSTDAFAAGAVDRVGGEIGSLPCDDDAARFASFFASVGSGFSETELRSCDDALGYFEDRAASLREEYERRRRVRAILTLFVCATVCLLVL